MSAIKRKILVSVKPGELEFYAQRPLVAGDVGAYEIVLVVPYDLEGAVFAVSAKRADGAVVTDMGSIAAEGGKLAAVYTLKNNMYAIAGMLELDLQLSRNGSVLTECRLLCDVCEGHSAANISGDDRVPILAELINRAAVAADAAQGAVLAATEAASRVSGAVKAALDAAETAAAVLESSYVTVTCNNSNDNVKIQAAINAAPMGEKTMIHIIGAVSITQTIGAGSTYCYYICIPQNKDIVLDFGGCTSVSVNAIYGTSTSGIVHAMFYQEGNLELIGLSAGITVGAGVLPFFGPFYLVYNAASSPANVTMRYCKYTTVSSSYDAWGYHYGVNTYGNAYVYDTEITIGGYEVGMPFIMCGSGKYASMNNCVMRVSGSSGSAISVAGTGNTLCMHNSKLRTSDMYGICLITTNASSMLFMDSDTVIGRNLDSTGGSIGIYNGEIKNCSIDSQGTCAIRVLAGGTRGGVALSGNILYSGGTVNNSGGSSTYNNSNVSPARACPVF